MNSKTKLTIMVDKDVVEWGKSERARKGYKRQDDYWNEKLHELKRAGEYIERLRTEAMRQCLDKKNRS